MRKLVALIDPMTSAEDAKFIEYLKGRGYGYWHWMNGSWLITIASGQTGEPEQIRDEIQRISPQKRCYIFEVSVKTNNWAGFGPNTKESNMASWLDSEWHT